MRSKAHGTRLALYCSICSSSVPITRRPSRCLSNCRDGAETRQAVSPQSSRFWCGRGQQIDEHLVESLSVKISLYLGGRPHDLWSILLRPTQGISVTSAGAKVHIQITCVLRRDQTRVEPRQGSEFVPQIVVFARQARIRTDIARRW